MIGSMNLSVRQSQSIGIEGILPNFLLTPYRFFRYSANGVLSNLSNKYRNISKQQYLEMQKLRTREIREKKNDLGC